MSVSLESVNPARTLPESAQLDETVWQAWLAKGREREKRGNAARIKGLQWISVAALLVAAALWSDLGPAGIVIKFIVTAGALVSLVQAFRTRHYSLAIVFAALMVLYNPWVPLIPFPGNWQWIVVLLSAVPFLLPLASRSASGARA